MRLRSRHTCWRRFSFCDFDKCPSTLADILSATLMVWASLQHPKLENVNPKRTRGMFLQDTWRLSKPSTSIEIIFYLVYVIESVFSTACDKQEVKGNSYAITMNGYKWYMFESMSFVRAEIYSGFGTILYCNGS